jgi:hypothetical protein
LNSHGVGDGDGHILVDRNGHRDGDSPLDGNGLRNGNRSLDGNRADNGLLDDHGLGSHNLLGGNHGLSGNHRSGDCGESGTYQADWGSNHGSGSEACHSRCESCSLESSGCYCWEGSHSCGGGRELSQGSAKEQADEKE